MKKIYVDKLPKTCFECLCGDEYLGCNLGCTFKTCKLKSIDEYEQQIRADERKKICEKIRGDSEHNALIGFTNYIIPETYLKQIEETDEET